MQTPVPVMSVQDEVLGNIRRQAIGPGTVADLNLPEDFLKRVADRVIRSSFQQHFRRVVGESDEPGAVPSNPPSQAKSPKVKTIVAPRPTPAARQVRAEVAEAPPPLPGFRAAVLEEAEDPWPFAAPTEEPFASAAALVRARLAHDGLLATTARAAAALGIEHLGNKIQRPKVLRRVGVPVDLIEQFENGEAVLDRIAAHLKEGADIEPLARELAGVPMAFTPTCRGLRIACETGERPVGALRVHATRIEYWGGRGAGSSLDVIRQLAILCRAVPLHIGAHESFADLLARLCEAWPDPGRIRIAKLPLPVSQWAQDNGKPCELKGKPFTLLPRYASRAEHDTTVIPGDTFIADALGAAGLKVAQSPLLFQGGNIAAVRSPAHDELVLLIGEAEVYRNIRLGLKREQAVDALRLEFGADQAVVLPAVSFHIDFEFTLRLHEGRLLAFVNDTGAAIRPILHAGMTALLSVPGISQHELIRLRGALGRMLPVDVHAALHPILTHHSVGTGAFPVAFTKVFSTAPHDSGIGNFHTFLLALDLLAAELMPAHRPPERHLRAYLESFTRRDGERRKLWRQLESLGATLVRIPSMADGERSLNYLNGLHEPGRYLMPAHGGLYAALDRAAADAFAKALPGVKIEPVVCAETQRRSGGLHCAAAVC